MDIHYHITQMELMPDTWIGVAYRDGKPIASVVTHSKQNARKVLDRKIKKLDSK